MLISGLMVVLFYYLASRAHHRVVEALPIAKPLRISLRIHHNGKNIQPDTAYRIPFPLRVALGTLAQSNALTCCAAAYVRQVADFGNWVLVPSRLSL